MGFVMFSSLRILFDCLTAAQKTRLLYLQVLIILMSILEVTSIALIGPFLSFIMSENNNPEILQFLSTFVNFKDSADLILYLGLFVLAVIFISTMISILTTFRLAMFSARTGAEISDRLFRYYCDQDILYHDSKNTSLITKNLSTETLRMTDLVINPLMQMNAKIVLSIFILIFIFVINPSAAIVGISVFLVTYLLIYLGVKKRLDVNGRDLTDVISQRFLIINECFGGIKETILLDKINFYHGKYTKLGLLYSRTRGVNHAISLAPRYLVELMAYGGIIVSILIYLVLFPNELKTFISLVSIYAIASLKLLPALQQIYTSITQIRGNITSFLHIKDDLLAATEAINPIKKHNVSFFEEMRLENVSFKYPNKDAAAINKISLKILRNESIAFVGPSGSGKSTLVNLVLGLLVPSSGELNVNGECLGFNAVKNRNSLIGYVPQDIYLTDKTILENIAFGVDVAEIDLSKVTNAIKSANLEGFIDTFEHGLNTLVGERGVQISGGQKQRIGIARALYNDPEILIFDEATSALDGNAEKLILESINSILHKKTIIMVAHRLNTVKNCDHIYIMEDGHIVESGIYDTLIRDSEKFRRMIDNG